MNIGEQIVTQLLEQSTPIIALYPGKFKPPHAGHFSVVAKAANIADKVIVIMSRGSKDEFTPEDSMQIWDLYKDILPSNVEIIISSNPSPLNDVFDMVKDKTQDYIVLYGKGEESRYNAIKRDREKYSNVDIVDAGSFENLNATDLRNAIRNKDLEDIQKFLPASIDAKKVLDVYTKDEFKPGPMLHEAFDKSKTPIIKKLVDFACEQLEIDQPHISLITSPSYSQEHSSFGGYLPSDEKIMVVVHNRNMADILRTLAHELVHHMQNRRGELDQDSGEDGSPIENEANATAGIIMRKFGRENPQIFEGKINEKVIGDKIECDNCGWTWDIKDGGDDLFMCHKCGHDNDSSNRLNEIGEANLEPYKWEEDNTAGRYIYTSFTTPTETKYEVDLTSTEVPDFEDKNEYIKAIDIEFSAKPKDAEGSSSKIVVNKGELYRVMSTIVDIIKYYLRQSNGDIKAILYSPSKKSNELDFGSQRDNLYKAFITKAIPGAKIEQHGEYVIVYILDDIDEYDVENEQDLKEFTSFLKEYTQKLSESEINEAEYQGRKVPLGKPMQGDSKKFKVYVKNSKGKVVKVNFGAKGMNIKKNNPVRRKAFRARHNCDNPGPRDKARYWSCRKW